MENLITGALEGDPTRAAQLIPKLTDPDQQQTALNRMAQTMFTPTDHVTIPEAAINWIRDPQGQAESLEAMDKFLTSAMTHKLHRDQILPKLSTENKAWFTARFPVKQ